MTLDRRQFLTSAATLALGLALPWARARAASKPLVIGALYVGSHADNGYNQTHAQAVAKLKTLPGVKVVEQENVPETVAVQQAMEAMIVKEDATLILATSFGYFPHVLKLASNYPEVRFAHCGGLWFADCDPPNVGSYFGHIDQCQYLNGIAAGHATRSGKLGFVAAKPIPQVLRNINAFTLGARSVNPDLSTQVIFTGGWSLPVREIEAVNALADQGIDVMTYHVDSPRVLVETAANRGLYICGYHADQSALAPTLYLTGAEWNWEGLYRSFVAAAQSGAPLANMTRGGLRDGIVRMSAYTAATPAAAIAQIDQAKTAMMAGGFDIFTGPLENNAGETVIAAGIAQTGLELEHMDYLVEGVLGAIAAGVAGVSGNGDGHQSPQEAHSSRRGKHSRPVPRGEESQQQSVVGGRRSRQLERSGASATDHRQQAALDPRNQSRSRRSRRTRSPQSDRTPDPGRESCVREIDA